jgi:hypothetical protein
MALLKEAAWSQRDAQPLANERLLLDRLKTVLHMPVLQISFFLSAVLSRAQARRAELVTRLQGFGSPGSTSYAFLCAAGHRWAGQRDRQSSLRACWLHQPQKYHGPEVGETFLGGWRSSLRMKM